MDVYHVLKLLLEKPDNSEWLEQSGYNVEHIKKMVEQEATKIFQLEQVEKFNDIFTLKLIQTEYDRLVQLTSSEPHAVSRKLCDMYELIIKLPILVTFTYWLSDHEGEAEVEQQNAIMYQWIIQKLSLGDWYGTLIKMNNYYKGFKKRTPLQHLLYSWIRNVLQCLEWEKKIIPWRNKRIGHGALGLLTNEKLKVETNFMLQHLQQYLTHKKTHAVYKELQFFTDQNNLHVKLSSNQTLKLQPFMQLQNSILYLFDTLYQKSQRFEFLDYAEGVKEVFQSEELIVLYSKLKAFQQNHISNNYTEKSLYRLEFKSEFEAFLKREEMSNKIIPVHYLQQWLENNIERQLKGIFHIQMEEGMGKSTFARQLAQQKHLDVRVIALKHFIPDQSQYFKQALLKELTTVRTNNGFEETIYNADLYKWILEETSQNICSALNAFRDKNNQLDNEAPFVLIIDGLDELTPEAKQILSFLDDQQKLQEKIYIVLLSRPSFELKVPVNQSITVYKNHPENLELLQRYLTSSNIGNEIQVQKLLAQLQDPRFLYVKPLVSLIQLGMRPIDLTIDKIIPQYLSVLKEVYNPSESNELFKLIALLGFFNKPLTIKEIATLLYLDEPRLSLLMMLIDLRCWLKFDYQQKECFISFNEVAVRKLFKSEREIASIHQQLLKQWSSYLVENELSVEERLILYLGIVHISPKAASYSELYKFVQLITYEIRQANELSHFTDLMMILLKHYELPEWGMFLAEAQFLNGKIDAASKQLVKLYGSLTVIAKGNPTIMLRMLKLTDFLVLNNAAKQTELVELHQYLDGQKSKLIENAGTFEWKVLMNLPTTEQFMELFQSFKQLNMPDFYFKEYMFQQLKPLVLDIYNEGQIDYKKLEEIVQQIQCYTQFMTGNTLYDRYIKLIIISVKLLPQMHKMKGDFSKMLVQLFSKQGVQTIQSIVPQAQLFLKEYTELKNDGFEIRNEAIREKFEEVSAYSRPFIEFYKTKQARKPQKFL